LAEALSFSESRERGRELALEAVEGARRLGEQSAVAEVLSNAMWPLWTPDNLEWRTANATEIAELAKQAGAIRILWEGQTWLVGAYMEAADVVAIDAQLAECQRTAEQVREPVYVGFATMLSAMRALLAGDVDKAEQLAWHALVDFGHEGENTSLVQLFGVQLFHIRVLQGRIGELHAATAGMAEHFAAVAATHCSLAALYCEAGRVEEARAEFELLAADDFRWIPRDIFWFSCMDHLAEICAYLEDEKRAPTLYEMLLPYQDRYIVNGEFAVPRGFATRHLGLLAATCGRFDEAVAHFEDALTRNARVGPPCALILTQLNYAQVLLTRNEPGDRDRAFKLLETAFRDSKLRRYPGLTDKIAALMHEAEADGQIANRRRRTLGERATQLTGGARIAMSTRGRAALGKLFGGASDEALERRFGSHVAQRALFAAMASSFQPRAAYGFEGEIAFELSHYTDDATDRPPDPDSWTIRVKRHRAFARRRTAENAAVSVRISIPDFVRLFSGELNPVAVWLERRGRAEGDVTLGARLVEMFGGVAALDVVPPDEQTYLPHRVDDDAVGSASR
jgi:tetratricopeptide (TPR) repeat protein